MVEIVCIMLDEILNTQVTSCFYIIVLFLPSWKSFIVEKHSHWTHSTSCLAEVGCCWKHGIRPDRKKTHPNCSDQFGGSLTRSIKTEKLVVIVGWDMFLKHGLKLKNVYWNMKITRLPALTACVGEVSSSKSMLQHKFQTRCTKTSHWLHLLQWRWGQNQWTMQNMANMIQSGFTVTPAGHVNTSIYTSISNILIDPSSHAYYLISTSTHDFAFFLRMLAKQNIPNSFRPLEKHGCFGHWAEAVLVAQNALKANDAAAKSADFLAAQPDPSDAIQQDLLLSGRRFFVRFFGGTDVEIFSQKKIHYGFASQFLVEVICFTVPHGFFQNDLNLSCWTMEFKLALDFYIRRG